MRPKLTAFITAAAVVTGFAPALAEMPYRGDGHMMVTPDALEWGAIASMAAPAEMTVIEGDLSAAEPFTFRLRLPDGYRILPHVHPAYERVTVLQGTLRFAHGEEFDADATTALPPGGVAIMARGEPMFGYAEGEVIMQLHGTGPWGITYVDPADDPRSDS